MYHFTAKEWDEETKLYSEKRNPFGMEIVQLQRLAASFPNTDLPKLAEEIFIT